MPNHGTHSHYTSGCRCTECKAAHAQYMREYRQKAGEQNSSKNKVYTKVKTMEWPYTQNEWMALDKDDFWWAIAMLTIKENDDLSRSQ